MHRLASQATNDDGLRHDTWIRSRVERSSSRITLLLISCSAGHFPPVCPICCARRWPDPRGSEEGARDVTTDYWQVEFDLRRGGS
jgi:hypothetical protein